MNITRPWRRGEQAQADDRPHILTPAEVFESPADFNRATRRWAGIVRGAWKWQAQAPNLPRYVRRHYTERIVTNPTTRRQRRHRARILRAMQSETR